MPRSLASLMLALVGAAAVTLAGPPAHAAKCAAPTTKAAARHADVVFSGTLTRGAGKGASSYTFEADHLYAGDLASSKVTVRPTARCALTHLEPDGRYMVFAQQGRGTLTTGVTDGTTTLSTKVTHQVRSVLGSGEDLTSSDAGSTQPSYRRVSDATTPTLARVAAPGVALVLIGLLGLLVVRRRA